ncbi:MAG: Holliday junction resolvase RuvX [Ruminococcaceae bacterium]|nr:Holliday junction resolvase RuvX [Oscillospiraceae bacterium]
MRIIGIDYGDSRVGIALSDPLGITAQGLKTLPNKVYDKMLDALVEIINTNGVCRAVIGMPKNLNGSLGIRAEVTNDFASDLKSRIPELEIVFQDERLTTVEASTFLNSTNTRGKSRKAVIDTVAAEIILQSYLDANPIN